jgi:hypothetical protein
MELTYGDIFSTQDSLAEVLKVEVKASVGIKLAKMVHVLQDEIKLIFDQRNKLIEKHGEKVKGVVQVVDGSKKWKEFQVEINELLATKTTLDITKVQLPPDLIISPSILFNLEKFIEIEGD